MNTHRSTHRGSARFALSALLALPAALAFGQDAKPTEETTKLEAFSVTGSRIKRIDAETPQPVARISEADFKASGFTTLGDAIRAMPQIAGTSLVSIDGGTSFTPGVSSFNLRGLGGNNTLVLINGRRAAPFASGAFNGFQTVFDFNSIPVAAIESLEILKDGASAIYGSDAVAGVINLNLKKNYTGMTSEISYGNTLATDSAEKSAFFIFGAQAGKISIVTTFDFQERSGIDASDLAYTRESNGTPYGGFDQRSSSGPIGSVRGLADRVRFPGGTAFFATPQTNPTLAGASAGIPLYNFQENVGFAPDSRSFGYYGRMAYEFSDKLAGWLELSFRRSEVNISAAPTPLFSANELGNSPTGSLMFPATNPFNPFGQNITDIRWRLNQLGRRDQESIADTPRFAAGLQGDLPFEGWTWDGALLYTKNTVTQLSRNVTSDRLVQQAFDGVVINGVTKYANPFGPNDPDVMNYLRIVNPNHDTFEVRAADISVSGPLFKLPGGDLSIAAGAEVRTERLENIGTQLNRDAQIVGGSVASDTFGDRRLYSFYAEVTAPLLKDTALGSLELQAAFRHESYSDFGETTKPKVAAVWRPLPELLVRGSLGESFLAPNLSFLYTSLSVSFTPNTLADPLRPADPRNQIRQFGGGNPNLQPEETKVAYTGLVLQPFARNKDSIFRELSFGVDYFKFDQENLINRLAAGQILANPAFAPLVVRNAPAPGETVGTISHVLTTWQNLSTALYEGYDLNARWVLPKNRFGQFRVDLSGTYLHNYDATTATGALVDFDGTYNFPQFRGNATLAWSRGDWAASLYVSHIGEYLDGFGLARVSAQYTVNPQIAYKGWMNSTITIGARNVFDQEPPRDLSDSKLVNENVNFAEPMFVYVRVSKDW